MVGGARAAEPAASTHHGTVSQEETKTVIDAGDGIGRHLGESISSWVEHVGGQARVSIREGVPN